MHKFAIGKGDMEFVEKVSFDTHFDRWVGQVNFSTWSKPAAGICPITVIFHVL